VQEAVIGCDSATEFWDQALSLCHNPSIPRTLRKFGTSATTDPDEIASRRRQVGEFKQAINENRLHSEGPASRKIYP
jgi:hypothetical protein